MASKTLRKEVSRHISGTLRASGLAAILAFAVAACPSVTFTQEKDAPPYLYDRGSGVATSMYGTYVRQGEFLIYPFLEYYNDANIEYKPADFGYGLDTDYRGSYKAFEELLFLGYGLAPDLAIELEAAYISAELEKSSADTSGMPRQIKESGIGDVEAQIRWRWMREDDTRPEGFMYFETVFPLQKNRQLIGTQDWEFKLGLGLIKGYSWGTMTVRAAVEYLREEPKLDAGEYAVEYLKRLSEQWRIVAAIEGNQLDEVSLITEAQWHFSQCAYLKANVGWGLTTNATDFAPELGVMIVL